MSVVLLDAQSHGNFTLTHQANERSNDGPTEHPKVLKTSWHWDPHLGYICHEVSEDWKVWFFLEFADDIQFCTLLCTFNYPCSSYMELKRVEKSSDLNMWDFAKGCLFQDSWHYVLLDFLFEELNVLNYWQFALPLIPYFHERMYCTCRQKVFDLLISTLDLIP